MTDQNIFQLMSWYKRFASRFRPEVHRVPIHPDLRHCIDFETFAIQLSYKGGEIWSAGTDRDQKMAFLKAIVEMVERVGTVFYSPRESTNGNACHFSQRKAREAAINELIERDAFFSHFLSGKPFCKQSVNKELLPLVTAAKKSGVIVEFYSMQTVSKGFAILCAAQAKRKNRKALNLGACFDPSPSIAFRKSYEEAMKTVNGFFYGNLKPLPKAQFKKAIAENHFLPHEHMALGCDPQIASSFAQAYLNQQTAQNEPLKITDLKIKTEVLNFELQDFRDCGLFFAKARSHQLQTAFWGYPRPSQICLSRIQLSKKGLRLSDIPWDQLHLFG